MHQEAGVVTRAVRDYLRDDISEIWIDNENAYIEAAGFIDAVMPTQADKLRKYTDYEPMFARFNVEKQIETAYQREVRLPSGGSIVIDQTEALVSIDINSAKSTKGSDVAETAYHTNLEAADEIARQLRLRDMGGLIVIDFIDMNDNKHQKEVEKRLVDATKYDRARVQFGEISKFGLMEMSRQRLRPSLEESTGYICPRCHGNGMIRDLRSLSLSIMRQIEQIALKERQGEVQAEVPTDIAAFILNEKRDSLVYLEQDSGTRITILPHAHLESPNFKLHFNRDGFAPTSYERITDTQQQEHSDLGYDVDWQTADAERPEQQPTRKPRKATAQQPNQTKGRAPSAAQTSPNREPTTASGTKAHTKETQVSSSRAATNHSQGQQTTSAPATTTPVTTAPPQAVAWLSNLFAQAPQAQTSASVSSRDAAEAIEALVNTGAQSLGSFGQVDNSALAHAQSTTPTSQSSDTHLQSAQQNDSDDNNDSSHDKGDDKRRRKSRKPRPSKSRPRKEQRDDTASSNGRAVTADSDKQTSSQDKRETNKRSSDRGRNRQNDERNDKNQQVSSTDEQTPAKRKAHSKRDSRGKLERGETLSAPDSKKQSSSSASASNKAQSNAKRSQDPNEVTLQVNEAPTKLKTAEVVHLSLDDSKADKAAAKETTTQAHVAAADKQSETGKSNDSKPSHKQASQQATASTDATPADASTDEQAQNGLPADTKTDSVKDSETAKSKTTENSAAQATAAVTGSDDYAEFTLTPEDLFAERYVTAQKFGQASNDPRVVRQQQASTTQANSTPAPMSAPTIRGTVGEFIRTVIADADSRLQTDGVIRCFIDAIEAQVQPSESAKTLITDDSKADDWPFDFSNYGYEPLSADYIARFDAMTQAVSQFALAQGKTEVAPRAISKRASNDPRGQHPDYQSEQPSQEVQPQTDLASETVANDTQTDVAQVDATQTSEQIDAHDIDAHDIEADALSSQQQADNITTESEQLLEVERTGMDESAKEEDSAGKSKTTIASYKNMIENVAEQLLPQTGMFNLTTPKVPKARSRKPKAEHKKPSQAEKAQDDAVETERSNSDS